jgi:hypothetical protein
VTTILSTSVERRCRPLDQWPQLDRSQWQSALQAGDPLEEGGCRAERSPFSNRAMVKGYGRWLAWLDSNGLLDAQLAPGDRITRDRVKAYAKQLESENASGTVIARLIEAEGYGRHHGPRTGLVLDLSDGVCNPGPAQAGPAEAAAPR